jgi:hypothetical protein
MSFPFGSTFSQKDPVMNRLRLAALILTAGLGFVSGCSACYSFGRPDYNGGGGGFLGLFHRNTSGSTALSVAPECCQPVGVGPAFGPPCCEGGFAPPGVGGPFLMPQEGMIAPPAGVPFVPGPNGAPTSPPPPLLTEPPLGSNTKLSPVPQSIPFPYSPVGY